MHVCDVFDYISDEKIKTTRDQVTTHSNIPVSNFLLLNSVDSLTFQVIAAEHEVSLYYKGLHFVIKLTPSERKQ